jgi:hypothetical protein
MQTRPGKVLTVSLLTLASVSCGKANSQKPAALYTIIDDMEATDGGGHILWPPGEGQGHGFWSSSTVCSPTDSDRILPVPFYRDASGWSYDAIPEKYQTRLSTHAAHLRTKTGETLQGVWGANIGFDLAEQPDPDGGALWPPVVCKEVDPAERKGNCPSEPARPSVGATVDLSDHYSYSGLTFWAMASPYGRQAVRVQINDTNTDPRGGRCNSLDPNNVSQCYNGFGKAFMLTDTFTQYWVDFSELHQNPSWGCRLGGLDLTQVYGINFEVDLPSCAIDPYATCAGDAAPVSFDIWIDDLYFESHP